MGRKVYLILTHTGTVFTNLIKLYTKQPYNHASLSFDPDFHELYSFGRKNPRNPFSGGFVKENINSGLLKRAKCAIYSCTVSESQYEKMKEFVRQIENQKHLYSYNLVGLLAIPLKMKIVRENAFFCSQFVSTVLMEGEVARLAKPPFFVTPHDLEQLPQFQLVYEGSIKDYCEDRGLREATENRRGTFVHSMVKKIGTVYSAFIGL